MPVAASAREIVMRDGARRAAAVRNAGIQPVTKARPVNVVPAKPKLRRAEKVEGNRRSLFRAAAQVVGSVGYTEASIAAITQAAGLAQGTFYRYFESRQDLFNRLLPYVGQNLVNFLAERVAGSKDIFEVEEKAISGSFDFLAENPGFYRILNEAEFAAPQAYEEHFQNLVTRFLASLERSRRGKQLKGYKPEELETLVYMLMAMRSYIHLRYGKGEGGIGKRLPDTVRTTYMKFLRGGLSYGSTDK